MKQRIVKSTLKMMVLLLVSFEYLMLFWFWCGADTFNILVTPVIFIIYFFCFTKFKQRANAKGLSELLYKGVMTIGVPIITIVTVWMFASIFGIEVIIL